MTIPVTEQAGGKWPAVLKGERVAGTADDVFLKRVVEGGLSVSEAKGMVASWRKALFEAEGVRLLMFLSAEDYAAFCPLEIRPAATEMARVGVIWVEF